MDRPNRRSRPADPQHRRSHPINPNSLRTGQLQQQHPQQQQLTSGGNYSSTESENEDGAAVYESLTHNTRKALPAALPLVAGSERPLFGTTDQRLVGLGLVSGLADNRSAALSANIGNLRTTNLDDHSPTRLGRNKDFSKSQLYELLRLSSETGSPETDDMISETSNENNNSDCPTVPVQGNSHTGSYANPSAASDISCNALTPHPLYQYGVQQLSAQHLHNPYLTSPHHLLLHHQHHHHPGHPIYYSNQDPALFLDDQQDKHAPASSPATSSDRCLLPTSSSANIGKLSNNSSVIASETRHLFNPSMSRPSADRDRPLSEHYLANTILRSTQCPIHTTPGSLYPSRTNLRPAASGKSLQKRKGLHKLLTWRNMTLLMALICLALIGALGYFAVISGNHRQEDLTKCSRAQEVISPNQFGSAGSGSIITSVRVKRSRDGDGLSVLPPLASDAMTTDRALIKQDKNDSYRNNEFPMIQNNSNHTENDIYKVFDSNNSKPTENNTGNSANAVDDITANSVNISHTNGSEKNDSTLDTPQQDTHVKAGKVTDSRFTFTILQDIVLTHYADETGQWLPRIILQNPQIFSRDKLAVISRAGRDLNDNESWDVKGFPYNVKGVYPNEDISITDLHMDTSTDLSIPAKSFWTGRMVQKRAGNIVLNVTISPTAVLVLYGRKDEPPTHAENDFTRQIRGVLKHKRQADINPSLEVKTIHERLDAGIWFFSLYNDMSTDEAATLYTGDSGKTVCLNDCHGQGSCIDGVCQCVSGFGGEDCSQAVCPLLCNGHGKYSHGACQCFPGWKGSDCDIPEFQCDDPLCSGHGKCWNGKCNCDSGYSGPNCQTVDCPKECTSHGVCVNGSCFCQPGWQGISCGMPVNDSRQLCGNHGTFNIVSKKCDCEPSWTGTGCTTEVCQPSCGSFGKCTAGKCVCDALFTGPTCEIPRCPNCGPRGRCINGTCVCDKGWTGRLCATNACPNDCNGHGSCIATSGSSWKCQCEGFWKGDSCSIPVEKCDDGRDNDGDGAVDCEDNDCCTADICAEHVNCATSPEPQDVLLREQAPPDTASFFDRVRFLIRENGVQNFVDRASFDPKRVSIIRGKIVDSSNTGLVGVRVSVQASAGETSPWGFTVSRRDGTYDLLLNGGGSQTVLFQKGGYRQTSTVVLLSWNEFACVEPMKMYRDSETARNRLDFIVPPSGEDRPCEIFNTNLEPELYPFWKHFPSGGLGNAPVVYYDAQVLQESFNISGSELRLNHFSSRTTGFASLLLIKLTKNTVATGLTRIIVRVSNAGLLEEKTYDAAPNLSHIYAWTGSNAYKQQIFGFSNAKVSIGYEGRNCKDVHWIHKVVKMKGVDMPVSEIGGWDLNAQHRYNPEGILHRGDGSNVYFSEGVLSATPYVGSGQLRAVNCKDGCPAAAALSIDLLAPIALASGPDGSLYVGDFNLIRRVRSDGIVVNLLQLQSPAMLQKYYMAVNPVNGQVYLSIAPMLKVIRIASLQNPQDLSNNYDSVVGNGEQCVPRANEFLCGDGQPAAAATLIYPKGIAFDKSGVLYIADGGAIRAVDENGVIRTHIPQTTYGNVWTPLPCGVDLLDMDDLSLRWPTSVAINPVDGALFILDGNMLLSVDKYKKARIAAGHSINCPNDPSPSTLNSPNNMAISPTGIVYVTEGNERAWRIRRIDGDFSDIVMSSCVCNATQCAGCTSSNKGSEKLLLPGAVAVAPNDVLHVSDMKSLKIYRVAPAVPRQNARMEYEIEAADAGELYTFDRFGHHTTTKNLFTGALVYQFSYTVDTAFGKVRSVRNADDKTVLIQRDYKSQVKSIECGAGWKINVNNSVRGFLKDIAYPDGFIVSYVYDAELTGLIVGKSDSNGQSFGYKYDKQGRLVQVTYPNGYRLALPSDDDKAVSATEHIASGAYLNENINGEKSMLVPSRYFIRLESKSPIPLTNTSLPTSLYLRTDNNASLQVNMNYALRTEAPQRLRRSLKVNDTTLFNIDFIPSANEEILTDREGTPMFSTKFDSVGRVISLKPLIGDFVSTNFTYDSAGRLMKWEQGTRWKTTGYNEVGLPVSQKYTNGAAWKFEYNDKRKVSRITKGSGTVVRIDYSANGGVQSITAPKGNIVVLKTEPMILFRRYMIKDSEATGYFSQDFDDRGNMVSVGYPSGLRKVTLLYDDSSRLTEVRQGRSSILFNYNQFGQPIKVSSIAEDLVATTEMFYFSNILLAARNTKYSGMTELEPVSAIYEYDEQLNLLRRRIQVGHSDVSVTDFQINPRSRQLTRFGPFSSSQSQIGALIVSDDNAIYLKQLDNTGKIRNHVLRLQHKIAASTETIYNEMGAVSELKIRKRENDPQISYAFKYDLEGHLIEATKNKQPWWNFAYDLNGNLFSLLGNGRLRNMTFKNRDHLSALSYEGKDVTIVVDQDGFLVQKGDVNYDYDPKGQLRRVIKDGNGGFDLKYFYDEKQRLIARQGSGNDVTQYIYGDWNREKLVTHVYLKRTQTLIQFFYDTLGQLIAMARDGNPYYILQSKLTVTILDQQGKIVKDVYFSPFGEIESDSNADFYYPFDQRNYIRDDKIRIVFYEDGLYDAEMGRLLSPKMTDLRQFTLQQINPFIYQRNDPLSSVEEKRPLLAVNEWAEALGLRAGFPVSTSTLTDVLDLKCAPMGPSVLTPLNHSCVLQSIIDDFQSWSITSPRQSFAPDPMTEPLRISSSSPFYGRGVILSASNLSTEVIPTGIGQRPLNDAMMSIFNNTQILPWHINRKSKEYFYAVKAGAVDKLDLDLSRLRTYFQSPMITFNRIAADVSIAVQSENLVFNISYTSDVGQMVTSLKEMVRQEMIKRAWEYEKGRLSNGQLGFSSWSETEKAALLSEGKVPGYEGYFVRDISTYPALADDPANIAFIRSRA